MQHMQRRAVESQSIPRTRQVIDERRGARISCCRVGRMTLGPFSNAPMSLSVALRSLSSDGIGLATLAPMDPLPEPGEVVEIQFAGFSRETEVPPGSPLMTIEPDQKAIASMNGELAWCRAVSGAIRHGDEPRTYEMGVRLHIETAPMAAQLAYWHWLLDAIQACRRAIPA